MNCRTVRRKRFLDSQASVPDAQRRELQAHLLACATCRQEWAERKLLRDSLRALPPHIPPPDLTVRLRVLASRHLQQPQRGWFGRGTDRLRLEFQDLMRPLAVPLAG